LKKEHGFIYLLSPFVVVSVCEKEVPMIPGRGQKATNTTVGRKAYRSCEKMR
jgi:hypothetical protein